MPLTLEELAALPARVERLEALVEQLEARLADDSKVDPEKRLTVDEAAAFCRCSTKTIRRMVSSGSLHNYGQGRTVRVRLGDLVRR
jgi:excisionase family DNA binding protein